MTFIELTGMIVVVALVSCLGVTVAKHFGAVAGIATGIVVAVTFAVLILRHWEATARRKRAEKEPNQPPEATR